VAWKAAIPGRGWSSPIVWGRKLFLTSAVSEGAVEEPKKGLYYGGNRPAPPPDVHRWVVYCLDTESGKVLWEKAAHRGAPRSSHHLKNTLASETPVTDGERVYAYFGNLGLFAYDLDGKEVWSHEYRACETRYGWGTAASPVLHGDRLFIVNDNEEEASIAAFDTKSGKELWRQKRDEKSNWATPFVWENESRVEVVTCGSRKVRSYDLDGNLLWELAGMSSIAIPTPVARGGLLYVSSGFVMDKLRPVYAVRAGAKGDLSLKDDESTSKHIAWCERQAGPYNPSPVVYGDSYYVLLDRGFLTCHDAKTGKEIYGKQRLSPEATAFTTSPWAYAGKVFCLSEDGDTFVVEAGPEFKVLRKNSLNEMCMSTPAIAHKSLFIRTLSNLYRIQAKGG
jgi:outer membrane protein assembly factor BamB